MKRIKRHFSLLKDFFTADLFYAFPYVIKWFYRLNITRSIKSILITKPSDSKKNTAVLYLHNKIKRTKNKEATPLLLIHAVHSHPCSLLHFADLAEKAGFGPVFSIYLPYDEHQPKVHRYLFKKCFDVIEKILKENNKSMKGVIVAGHSLGAIEASYRAFVNNDVKILAVISIAGRLRFVQTDGHTCAESLKPTVKKVFKGIQSSPHIPLYQIVGQNDWNAPLEATLIRSDGECHHIVEDAAHFNILYHKDTRKKFVEFLKKAVKK